MRRSSTIILILVLAGAFAAGAWFGKRVPEKTVAGSERKVLYYVDPMNPSHTSDKPGLAPCGMKLEPVYADASSGGQEAAGSAHSMAPGTVKISPEKQQMIGIKKQPVEKVPMRHVVRTLGRVTIDETRTYQLNASTDGWIRDTYPNSTGSLVKEGEVLATFYGPEFLSAEQAFIFALGSLERAQKGMPGHEGPSANTAQIAIVKANIQQYKDSLSTLGMCDLQIEELGRTKQLTEEIQIVAPATSFIVARNVSPGQRFDRGAEWYRLADLSHVWVLADLFESEAQYTRPGLEVRVSLSHQRKAFDAAVSDILPQFDPTTQTLKVRLEVENPDFSLRPDMFVDVEFPVELPPAIIIPADAVLDSGIRKIVFIDKGDGYFEPRRIETGSRFGDKVEITEGLMEGEQIVVSGNFLIDSESRMKLAAAGMFGNVSKCPACGMDVEETKARSTGLVSEYEGKTYFFCRDECKRDFDKHPEAYLKKKSSLANSESWYKVSAPAPSDPVCSEKVEVEKAKAAGLHSSYSGRTYYFCSSECKNAFDKDPATYTKKRGAAAGGAEQAYDSTDLKKEKCPACGMAIFQGKAKRYGQTSELDGKTYYFCSDECKAKFDMNPEAYMRGMPEGTMENASSENMHHTGHMGNASMPGEKMSHEDMAEDAMKEDSMNDGSIADPAVAVGEKGHD